jgi:AcrR family transcriptional regulator
MSRGRNLQEMETGTKQSKTAVNAGAKAADPMHKLAPGAVAGQSGSWEDLGGPTPENYKSTDDSAKLKTPGATLAQVKDVVNRGAKSAEPMKSMKEESEDESEELVEDEYELEEGEELEEAAKEKEEDEEEDEEEEGEEEGEEDEEDDKKKKMKEAFIAIENEIEEDVTALLSGEELSEEFRDKAKTIFEAALNARTQQIEEAILAHYEEQLAEEVASIEEALTERLDAYLEYVADEWISENALAVERGIQAQATESFLSGLKGLFEEHYVSIPEDKYDVLESMVEKLDEMETKLNEQIEKNVSLNKRLAEAVADGIFEQVSEGLADTQKDKLASLAESVEFESEEEYREKLETLKESYFPSRVVSPSAKTETLSEGVDVAPESYSNSMSAYLKTLSAFSK